MSSPSLCRADQLLCRLHCGRFAIAMQIGNKMHLKKYFIIAEITRALTLLLTLLLVMYLINKHYIFFTFNNTTDVHCLKFLQIAGIST